MYKRPIRHLHWKDALLLLESGQRCTLKVWKLSTAEVLEYRDVVCVGQNWRRGTHRVKFEHSHLIREFRDVTLFEINGYEIDR